MQNKGKNAIYVSITELAKLLGISRVAVFKKIQKKQIPAEKIGRSYAISMEHVNDFIQNGKSTLLTSEKKTEIQEAVQKVVKEYGETLKLLGRE